MRLQKDEESRSGQRKVCADDAKTTKSAFSIPRSTQNHLQTDYSRVHAVGMYVEFMSNCLLLSITEDESEVFELVLQRLHHLLLFQELLIHLLSLLLNLY